ncbi:MAG: TolC family protein [Bacteroidales bacterium]|nr:TolC family protein [Bacteroidales bacterium]
MKNSNVILCLCLLFACVCARGSEVPDSLQLYPADEKVTFLTLDDAIKVALSESESVQIADKEVVRTGHAKKGTYAALFPQIDASGSYQRVLIKNDIRAMMGNDSPMAQQMTDTKIGSFNTLAVGASASMPLVNAALWKSIKISGQSVELAVEKARASRLDLVAQVKRAYYTTLLAKESFRVFRELYENALSNYGQTEKKYNAQKASELDMTTARTNLAGAIPNVYSAESDVMLALWQLKAVIGADLDASIDIVGSLDDYSAQLNAQPAYESLSLDSNSTMKQLSIQAEQLLQTVKMRQMAYVPTLAATVSITYSAVSNDPMTNLGWFPYSYAGFSLNIPIFSGGKRYHDVKQARNQYEQLQLQTRSTEKQLRISVQQQLSAMQTASKSYGASKDALASAEKAYQIAAKSYEVGRATLIELDNAQLNLTQCQLSLSNNIYSYIAAQAQLESILGEENFEVK